ncbi:MAG: MFS transporter [Acidobacteriaceae bacterium]|nr:MFS transporter [Acidobacteriaceae bacterium]
MHAVGTYRPAAWRFTTDLYRKRPGRRGWAKVEREEGVEFSRLHITIPLTRQLFLYFGIMSLLVYLVNPGFLLDIPTSYMLKNILGASASQISLFRLVTGIPFYLAFAFGMVRDLWDPLGQRDPGYFRIFVPLMLCVLAFMAFSPTRYSELLVGMLIATVTFSFIFAAYQGLTALVAQEAHMTGRLSAISNFCQFLPIGAAYFASGFMAEKLLPRQVFLVVLSLAAVLGIFGFWKPRVIFREAYANPRAQGTTFFGDVRRLLRHKAIYPVLLVNILWNFTPGSYTPMQFFLTNQLHAPDAIYADFQGLLNLLFLPPALLYGFLCQRFAARKLLLWSIIIGVPQFIPMAFIHTGSQALWAAVLIGLLGGLANVACIDIGMRACPPGLQGTMMMLIAATFYISSRGGDVAGSWIYGLSPKYGFQYCVIAITATYALILLVTPFIPKQITATADGEASPEEEASVLEETR